MANKLELTWYGKENMVVVEPRLLLEDKKLSNCHEGDTCDNMLIHGDNLLALKALVKAGYAGKIKCIYIDPPYNTGSAFEHYDDNLEHSKWLSLMKPRLELLKILLRVDGSIWISIDDDEHAYLKVLCDEVFGRCNFIASIVWQKRTSPDMRAAISDGHDYILVYSINKDEFKKSINKLPLSDEQMKNYKNPDNDPRGPWTSTDCTAQAGHGTKDQFYVLTTPAGRKIELPSSLCWRFTKERMMEEIAEGRIWLGKDGNGVPRKKTYLADSKGVVPWTWWSNKEVGHNQEAKKETNKLFDDNSFATPKPERLLQRIIHIASNEGDIVLDSFLGSGTTAAVAHKMKRNWIGVEFGEHAYTHCKVRLDKVIKGEQGGVSKTLNWNGGGSYKFYELAPSLINIDVFGEPVINKSYNADMLAAAVAMHEGCKYEPNQEIFWKQAIASETSYLFTTTRCVTHEFLATIHETMKEEEFLVIACKSFVAGADRAYSNIKVKKIPQMLLDNCEFGKDNYNLNIVNPPVYEDDEEVAEDD